MNYSKVIFLKKKKPLLNDGGFYIVPFMYKSYRIEIYFLGFKDKLSK